MARCRFITGLKMQAVTTLLLVLCPFQVLCQDENVVVQLPDLGHIKGRTVKTIGNQGHPQKNYYNFRNIPFAQSVSGPHRFSEPRKWTARLGTEVDPYDATKSGPLCPQLGLDPEIFDHYLPMQTEDALKELLEESLDAWLPNIAFDIVLQLLEDLFELPLLHRPVNDVITEMLDVDLSVAEDCLHLAVSTPNLNPEKPLPVMYFVYGGGYKAGTQYKMGYERLGDVNDVVLVAVNYRLGPLGFMCLASDESAGNMGLLDQVMGLEWVRDNIAHFGGDPNKVTIFGQSAGGASVTHLMMSPLAEGLFHQVLAQSGASIAPWAFDDERKHEYHTRRWAAMSDCNKPEIPDMIACLRDLDIKNLTKTTNAYAGQDNLAGGMGFGGINPCPQSHGKKKFYEVDQSPLKLFKSGNYTKVPLMAGACANDGTLVLSTAYSQNLVPLGLDTDEHFLKYGIIEYMTDIVDMDAAFAFTHDIQKDYFKDNEMGNFDLMTRGLTDLGGMMLLKAPGYRMVEGNSQYVNSYAYSLEKGAQSRKSFYYPMCKLGSSHNPTYYNVAASHADDLIYIFYLNLPVVFCDLQTFFAGLGTAYLGCLVSNPLNATGCVTDPNGDFKKNFGDCLFGELTEAESKVSDAMVKAWTNFAIYGTPTPSTDPSLPHLEPWSYENPVYLQFGDMIDEPVKIASDYRKTFSSKPPF